MSPPHEELSPHEPLPRGQLMHWRGAKPRTRTHVFTANREETVVAVPVLLSVPGHVAVSVTVPRGGICASTTAPWAEAGVLPSASLRGDPQRPWRAQNADWGPLALACSVCSPVSPGPPGFSRDPACSLCLHPQPTALHGIWSVLLDALKWPPPYLPGTLWLSLDLR